MNDQPKRIILTKPQFVYMSLALCTLLMLGSLIGIGIAGNVLFNNATVLQTCTTKNNASITNLSTTRATTCQNYSISTVSYPLNVIAWIVMLLIMALGVYGIVFSARTVDSVIKIHNTKDEVPHDEQTPS